MLVRVHVLQPPGLAHTQELSAQPHEHVVTLHEVYAKESGNIFLVRATSYFLIFCFSTNSHKSTP